MDQTRPDVTKFFTLWVTTRVRERGGFVRRGLLLRKTKLDEGAVVEAAADAVQVALFIGCQRPDFFWNHLPQVDATSPGDYAVQDGKPIERWLDYAEQAAELKLSTLAPPPCWRHLVAFIATRDSEARVFPWTTARGQEEIDFPSPEAAKMIETAVAGALIALGWAVRQPDRARALLDEVASEYLTLLEFVEILTDHLIERFESLSGS